MAEATALRNNALPYPIYGAPWTLVVPLLDADGDLVTGATTPDSEVSKNGDTFADCTNEMTEIATASGIYYLTLTGTEMTADIVAAQLKSATAGMKTTVAVLYPRKLVTVHSGTAADDGSGTSSIVLDSGASAVDDFYNGMVCIATIDSNVEVRVISDYTGSTKTATVVPDWNVAVDNTDTFVIKLPEGAQLNQANVTAWNSAAVASPHTAGYPAVTIKDGTGTGEIDTTSGGVLVAAIAANAITATAINADAITAAKIADGAIDAATFAAGAITATVIATGAIDADALAADAVAEIADGVWDEDATGHQTGGTFGQAIGDPGADTTTIYQSVVTDAAGTNVAADIIAVKAETAAILDDTDDIGVAGAGLTNINLPNQTMDIVGNITGNLSGSVGSVSGAVGSVTGNVGGNVTGSVGSVATGGIAAASFAAGAIDAAAIAANAIGASELAADAVAEIADAVWLEAIADHSGSAGSTAEALSDAGAAGTPPTVGEIADAVWDEATAGHTTSGTFGEQAKTDIDAIVTATGAAAIRTALGLASANLDTQIGDLPTNAELTTALGTADDAILTQVALVKTETDKIASIKTKTDSLTFTVAGHADINVQYVNDVQITGDGQTGTEWGPS